MTEKPKYYRYCFVPECTSTTSKTPNKIFLPVPRHDKLRKKWCRIARRYDEVPLSTLSRLHCCEDHFDLEQDVENLLRYRLTGGRIFLKKGVLPHKFDCQKPPKESTTRPVFTKRRKTELQETVFSKKLPSSLIKDNEFVDCGNLKKETPQIDPLDVVVKAGYSQINTKTSKYVQVNLRQKTTDKAKNKMKIKKECPQLACDLPSESSSDENISIHVTDFENGSSVDNFNSEIGLEAYRRHMQKGMLISISREPKLLLGLPKDSFFIIKLLSESINESDINIMITLKKIRLNQSYSLLAMDFGITEDHVVNIVQNVLPSIANCMKDLIWFPDKETLIFNLPIEFRRRYHQVQSIIECFEVNISKPSNAIHQALTWSKYKGCNTIKYLISHTPDGLINYISEGYAGRTTDNAIVENSNYLTKLPSDSVVLANGGFKHINHLLELKNCKLLRLPNVQSGMILTKKKDIETNKNVALRVHVERSIGRLSEFGFLLTHSCININEINMLDNIVLTACGIVNLQNFSFNTL